MSQLVNRKVVLKSHPQGALKESDFEIVNDEVGEVTAGSGIKGLEMKKAPDTWRHFN